MAFDIYRPTLKDITNGIELEGAEKIFQDSCKSGELAVIGMELPTEASKTNTIRASLIRHAMLGGCEQMPVSPKGVWIQGAWITDVLDLKACNSPLDLTLVGCNICEQPVLRDARLGSVMLPGCAVPGLDAHRMTVVRIILLNQKFKSTGTVDLSLANIGSALACDDAKFDGKGNIALNCDTMIVGANVFLNGEFSATGEVDLRSAQITGQLVCDNATFDGKGGSALLCDSMIVGGSVFLRSDFSATGEVNFARAQITGNLKCSEARFKGPLDCEGMTVGGGFFWKKVRGRPDKLDLTDAQVGSLRDDTGSWQDCTPILNGFRYDRILSEMSVQDRLDWLDTVKADDTPTGENTAKTVPDVKPQPFTHLAQCLEASGQRRGAARVRYEREQRVRPAENAKQLVAAAHSQTPLFWRPVAKAQGYFDRVFGVMFGYGHQPIRVLGSILVIWLFSCWLYGNTYSFGQMAPNSAVILTSVEWLKAVKTGCTGAWQAGCEMPLDIWLKGETGKDYETFSWGFYALDLFVPLDALGQENAWAPSKDRGWWGFVAYYMRWLVQLSGWVITAIGAATLTGVIGRRE